MALHATKTREIPAGRWTYTDDTEMAVAVYDVLARNGAIDQADLAQSFASRYLSSPARGYSPTTARVLQQIQRGIPWPEAAGSAFGGEGSLGNGAAMRVAPLGAYFADDRSIAASQAALSAEVTHLHAEAKAGAVAVAVAAAWTSSWAEHGRKEDPAGLLRAAAEHVPAGAVHDGLRRALAIDLGEWEFTAAEVLGNGTRTTAADTVPFSLWCAAAHLTDYPAALWAAVRVGGDMDTTAAIVGGIVACAAGEAGLSKEWLARREGLDLPRH